ncbi:hypothetical protein A2Z33_06400 [Candidatus Gottesmanbacteria bacterium RBG_16_52_11]|uniref:Uncharacterized protein n=1 Tax=Candidatus Gottesmanbacteria bacterium RBG_16_52_11 TaxID=1798374 RepID=A0A1F5YXJ1_9BACT|nr:MAG: hypothetical protein A2Z33_06400 [Candidatus Gottesmanbacteria bacterium RBG_16_52_11]
MINVKSLLAVVLLVLGLLPAQRLYAAKPDRIPGQILVKFIEGTSEDEINRQVRGVGGNRIGNLEALDVEVISVPEQAADRILTALSHNPKVEFAEPDFIAEASDPDPYYASFQWGFNNTGQTVNGVTGIIDADIDAPEAWSAVSGGVRVAVLDTGVAQSHADLSSKLAANRDFTGSSTGFNDIYGHGTHVAGIISAVSGNGQGVAGGCPNCTIMNGKVLNDSGSGAYSWIANGINWATDNGAKVINLSLGGSSRSFTLESAVNRAWNNGVIVAAAAGNSANQSKTYPAAYANAIAVAATDNRDAKAYFSSYGAKWVDVAAPGAYIFSTWNDSDSSSNPQPVCDVSGCYKFASGTSMATPVVSAVAGLVWASPYGSSTNSVRNRIESRSDPVTGTGSYWKWGRVNAFRSVSP